VFDSRGLPDYPPPHNAWEFPPPPVSPRWKWAAIAAMVFGLIGGTTMLAVAISYGSSGMPGVIDNARLISVIEGECARMTSTVESMPIGGSPERQASTIADQNEAVDVMVSAIRDVGPDIIDSDPPTEEWLTDWERLINARESYAQKILDGSLPDLEIPNDERGKDIYVRMDDAFLVQTSCEVPDILINPYPDDQSDA
jgi:hypothetical protein